MDQSIYHIPALLGPTIEGLDITDTGIYVDATYGGGGHSQAIYNRLSDGHLYAIDQDIDAVKRAPHDPRLTVINGNFRYMRNYLRYYGVGDGQADGVLADLGVSFHHFDDPGRGFSFRYDGPLDMRMNRSASRTAAQLIAESTEESLSNILYLYGELKNSRRLAAEILKAQPVETVQQLLDAVKPLVNPRQEKKELAQIFQALRIEVNDELGALKDLLAQSLAVLREGGRLAIITYHSLEDRIVKNYMKTGNYDGKAEKDFFGKSKAPMKLINSKPIVPDEQEVEQNPRSRSAKLRIAVKL